VKILVIPHAPAAKVRTRAFEFAKSLAKLGHDVDLYVYNVNDSVGLLNKILWNLREMLPWARRRASEIKKLNFLNLPTLHYGPQGLRDFFKAMWPSIVDGERYDLVFNASFENFPIKKRAGQKLIYDFVDDHADELKRAGHSVEAKQIENFISGEMNKADVVLSSSLVLKDICKERYGLESFFSPNGADVSAIKEVQTFDDENDVVKIGYVGGLDSWVHFQPVMEAIKVHREQGKNLELHIVGRGHALEGIDFPEWMYFHGFRPPSEIPGLLNDFDIGLLPFEVSPFTDAALPLKIIEYGAASLIAIASPIKELTLHRFPWVVLCQLDKESWVEAINKALSMKWSSEWDALVDQFNWDHTVKNSLEYIEASTN
jgi:glycosyltransferase involved in cell wall biosynthesis